MRIWILLVGAALIAGGCASAPEKTDMDEKPLQHTLRFHFPANPECEKQELAVTIHGLTHNGLHMYTMGKFLASRGYETYCFDYRTTRGTVQEHAVEFKAFLETLARKYPDYPINIVTHSMGGLVTRQTLGHLCDSQPCSPGELLTRNRIKRIVMLAPPNRGSKVASAAVKYVPFSPNIMEPLPDLSYGEDSPVHKIPVPSGIPIGIIAASADIAVPRDSTSLENQSDYLVMTSSHSFIMMRTKVQRQVLEFFQNAKFKKEEPGT